jgi:signal transduction histidine kinase
MVERDPAGAAAPLDFTLAQAERGLAEMRALIFELRPESLEQEGLVAALQRQVAALEARHQMSIALSVPGEPDAPLAVKEALYRIAQEALNNTLKHAAASTICVSLSCTEDEVALEVRDDGKGLDPSASFPGHLGLQSMRERATRLHGRFELESAPGAGTTVRARLPSRKDAWPLQNQ